jgi:regulator of replication initiation timing
MSVENKIKELLERVDAKASLEEASMMGASEVSKDTSIKPAKSGDSGAPKQGDSKDATYETRDEKEANQGAQVSKGIKKNDIQMKGPVGAAPNFTTVADPASVVDQPTSKGNVAREEVESEDDEVISEEDQEEVFSDVEEDEVPQELDLSPIFGEDLSEDFKAKATAIFEAAVIAKVNDEMEKISEALTEKFTVQLEEYKESIVEKVDAYLNYVVENWMEENALAVENGLRTEIAEDFISGLKVLFKEHYIEVPEEKYDVIGDLQASVNELEESLNTQIENNVSLNTEVVELKKQLIISEMTEDLADTEVRKLTKLLEGVDFGNEGLYREKVSVIKGNYFGNDVSTETRVQKTLIEETQTQDDYADNSVVSSYAKALTRTIKRT